MSAYLATDVASPEYFSIFISHLADYFSTKNPEAYKLTMTSKPILSRLLMLALYNVHTLHHII